MGGTPLPPQWNWVQGPKAVFNKNSGDSINICGEILNRSRSLLLCSKHYWRSHYSQPVCEVGPSSFSLPVYLLPYVYIQTPYKSSSTLICPSCLLSMMSAFQVMASSVLPSAPTCLSCRQLPSSRWICRGHRPLKFFSYCFSYLVFLTSTNSAHPLGLIKPFGATFPKLLLCFLKSSATSSILIDRKLLNSKCYIFVIFCLLH